MNVLSHMTTKQTTYWVKMKMVYCCLLLIMLIAVRVEVLVAQENADCLACHNDKSLTGAIKGKTNSVFVDEKKFSGSIHAKLACVDCHADIAGKELPHEAGLNPVECGKLSPSGTGTSCKVTARKSNRTR